MIKRFSIAFVLIGTFSCVDRADFKLTREQRAELFKQEQEKYGLDVKRHYTLKDCIDIAYTNSLEVQIKALSERMAKERQEGTLWAMMPALSVSGKQSERSNASGGTSVGIDDGKQSLRPSSSSEASSWSTRAELAWSTMDFGLAYYRHMKLDDEQEQARIDGEKAALDLRFRVVQAYFSAAAATHFMKQTATNMKRCEDALIRLEKNSDGADPGEMIRLRKNFLTTRLQLREYERSLKNHSLNLSSLMGVIPVDSLKVDTSPFDRLNKDGTLPLVLPAYNELLDSALKNRDELRTNDVNRHLLEISKNEKFIQMFPNVKLLAGHNWDSNKYLYNQSWTEVGASAMLDVMKIPQLRAELKAAGLEGIALKYREVALSMAVMAQLNIALNNLEEVKERTDFQSKIYQLAGQDLALWAGKEKQGQANDLLVAEKELAQAMAAMDRTNAIGNLYVAYYRVLTSVASSSMPLPHDSVTVSYDASSRNKLFTADAPGVNRGIKKEIGAYLEPIEPPPSSRDTGLRPAEFAKKKPVNAGDEAYSY